jgi:hypothetical protein
MDPTAAPNSISTVWDSISSVISTGLVAGTADVVNMALNPLTAHAAPVQVAPSSSIINSGSTMLIALAIVGVLVMVALKRK